MVVLIIGILAAVALPQYQMAVRKSRVSQVVIHLKALKTALEACVLVHPNAQCSIADGMQDASCATCGFDDLDISISDGESGAPNEDYYEGLSDDEWKSYWHTKDFLYQVYVYQGDKCIFAYPIGDDAQIYSLEIRNDGGIYCHANRRNEDKGRKICKGIGGKPDAGNAYRYKLF